MLKLVLADYIKVVVLVVFCLTSGASDMAGQEVPAQDAGVGQGAAVQTEVWYYTLRNKVDADSADEHFGGLRGGRGAGSVRVDFAPIPGLKELAEAAPFYLPGERITLQRVDETPEATVFAQVKRFADEHQGNIVIYIHGYNIGFEKGCRQAAIFQRALDERHRVVLFSWPADGDLLKYTRDEADLMWSVSRLADFFNTIVQLVGPGKVDVVAHSLGARGAVMALNRIACGRSAGPFLNELVLMAPDIDRDTFKDIWPEVRPLAQRTTVYVSENDRALKLSQEVHGYPRLGEAGEHITLLPGMETVDVSLTGNRRPSGHLYHLYTPEVVSDLAALLDVGQSAAKRSGMIQAQRDGMLYWQVKPNDR